MIAEIARYFPEAGALKIDEILEKSKTGKDKILEKVNQYNEILYDWVIPEIFKAFYEITNSSSEIEHEITLLKEPTGENKFYEFYADPALVAYVGEKKYSEYKNKSFHASHYCFDSRPELECFLRFLLSKDVKNVYFTGMFTDKNKTEFSIGYTDPETDRYRNYYPDFWVEMKDGFYQIIEVKGDDKLNDSVVQAKKEAALALTANSDVIYRMIAGSMTGKPGIVDPNFDKNINQFLYPETKDGLGMGLAADSGDVKEEGN